MQTCGLARVLALLQGKLILPYFDFLPGTSFRWNFWYSMAITMPAEISAATTLLGFWAPRLNMCMTIS